MAEKDGQFKIFEVKLVPDFINFELQIKQSQLKRLKRALIWFSECKGSTEFILVAVSHNGEIRWLEGIFG